KNLELLEILLWDGNWYDKSMDNSTLDHLVERIIQQEQDIKILRMLIDGSLKIDGQGLPKNSPWASKALDRVWMENDGLATSNLDDRIAKKIMKKEQDIKMLRLLLNGGMKFDHRSFLDSSSLAFNKALEDALKSNNTELLTLAIRAGAFPNATTLKLLEKTKDPSIRKLAAEATRAMPPRLRAHALKDSTTEFIQFLLGEKAITTEALWQFILGWDMRSGLVQFKQFVVSDLIHSNVLDLEEAKTLIADGKIYIVPLLEALCEKKYENILPPHAISTLINDPRILKMIAPFTPSLYIPLILDGSLDTLQIEPFITPKILERIYKENSSQELKGKFSWIETALEQRAYPIYPSVIETLKTVMEDSCETPQKQQAFKAAVKKAFEHDQSYLINSPELSRSLIRRAIFIGDLDTLKLLLENNVLLDDSWLWHCVLLREDQELNEAASEMIDLLSRYGKDSKEFMTISAMLLKNATADIINQKIHISILQKLVDVGVRSKSLNDSSSYNDDTLAFNAALQQALTSNDTTLLTLVIRAGAFPHKETTYELLKGCKDLPLLKIVKDTDPHQAFEANYLQALFGEAFAFREAKSSRCLPQEVEDLKNLVDQGMISKEALEKFVTAGKTKFLPSDIEMLVNSGILDFRAAITFIVNVFGVTRFLRACEQGRYEKIFSQPFASRCLQDPRILQKSTIS
ncbi:MAG: hypothetical protein ACM3JI_02610, partial [Anaerolineae bacterium]